MNRQEKIEQFLQDAAKGPYIGQPLVQWIRQQMQQAEELRLK